MINRTDTTNTTHSGILLELDDKILLYKKHDVYHLIGEIETYTQVFDSNNIEKLASSQLESDVTIYNSIIYNELIDTFYPDPIGLHHATIFKCIKSVMDYDTMKKHNIELIRMDELNNIKKSILLSHYAKHIF